MNELETMQKQLAHLISRKEIWHRRGYKRVKCGARRVRRGMESQDRKRKKRGSKK